MARRRHRRRPDQPARQPRQPQRLPQPRPGRARHLRGAGAVHHRRAGLLHLCAADFDKDGVIDVATTSVTSNQVSVIPGTGTGTFDPPVLIAILATGGVQSTIACRDLDGDTDIDLVVTSPSSARLSILVNQGDGTFAAPVAYTNALNGQTAGLAFGDADGDGKLDILANGAAGAYLFFFKGNGNGTFASGVQSATGAALVANSALGVVASDFNGDGKLDAYILYTTAAGGVFPMTGTGTGTFTAAPSSLLASRPASTPSPSPT
ncbi:FG-GAP repeat domain-containing protein [Nannocystis pusilla]|uniref:FG-GAP repeat domain-containing protein n=1 Tax=Nannocystis pusilla TaxID=889268 RepID=UPI003B7D59EA